MTAAKVLSIVALAILFASEVSILASAASDNRILRGDSVTFVMAIESVSGEVLLNGSRPLTVTPSEAPRSPIDLTRHVRDVLPSLKKGEVFRIDLQEPLGRWESVVVLPRIAGPFPFEAQATKAVFEDEFGPAIPGEIVRVLNPVVANVTVTSVTDDIVSYRVIDEGPWPLLLIPGEVSPIPLNATHYLLRIDVGVGTSWGWPRECKNELYSLTSGSYRVDEISDREIRMAYSPLPYPDIVGVPAVMTGMVLSRVPFKGDPLESLIDAHSRFSENMLR